MTIMGCHTGSVRLATGAFCLLIWCSFPGCFGCVDVIVYLPICFVLSVCSCVAVARACLYDRRARACWYTSMAVKHVLMGFAGLIAVR